MKAVLKRDISFFFSVSNFFLLILFGMMVFQFLWNTDHRGDYSYFFANELFGRDAYYVSFYFVVNFYVLFLTYKVFWNDFSCVMETFFLRLKKRRWFLYKALSLLLLESMVYCGGMCLYLVLCLGYGISFSITAVIRLTLGMVIVHYMVSLIYILLYGLFRQKAIILMLLFFLTCRLSNVFSPLVFYHVFHWGYVFIILGLLLLLLFFCIPFFHYVYERKKEIS